MKSSTDDICSFDVMMAIAFSYPHHVVISTKKILPNTKIRQDRIFKVIPIQLMFATDSF